MKKICNVAENQQLTDSQRKLSRDVLENISGKWAFWILHALGEAGQPMRFARLLEAAEGISQKVLTRTLRLLEGDGFLTRTVFAEVPPRVEYELTDLGKDVLSKIEPLLAWVVTEVDSFASARVSFEKRYKKS